MKQSLRSNALYVLLVHVLNDFDRTLYLDFLFLYVQNAVVFSFGNIFDLWVLIKVKRYVALLKPVLRNLSSAHNSREVSFPAEKYLNKSVPLKVGASAS